MELSGEELSKMQKSEMETSERKRFERDDSEMEQSLVGRCVGKQSLMSSFKVFSGVLDEDTKSTFE